MCALHCAAPGGTGDAWGWSVAGKGCRHARTGRDADQNFMVTPTLMERP